MSIEQFGHDPYPNGAPLTDGESRIFDHIRNEILESEARSCILSNEQPRTLFRMETLAGVATFTIYAWGSERSITPESAVLARMVGNNIKEASCSEFKIYGASEETYLAKLGQVSAFADLLIAPLSSEPLWKDDLEISEELFQDQVDQGAIVSTQLGYLRRVEREPLVIPGVVEFSRLSIGSQWRPKNYFV